MFIENTVCTVLLKPSTPPRTEAGLNGHHCRLLVARLFILYEAGTYFFTVPYLFLYGNSVLPANLTVE
jgi:hypothetical protein